MSTRPLEPEFDPRLVEAAVLAAVARRGGEGEFHAERDGLYQIAEPEPREAAFAALHARWFERLALDRPFRETLAERPTIAARCGRWLVARARGTRDEAADLLVAPSAPPTLLVRVTAETVATAERLSLLLRRELLHVADMLDPRFGYAPSLPASAAGGARESVVRGNYRVLWDAYVDGRLARLEAVPLAVRAERLAEFVRAFPHLGERAVAAFERFFGARELTHAELLAFAVGGPAGAPLPRCRLCDLPTHAFEPAPEALAAEVLAAIARDFPSWRPADGLCGRCAELYVSRVAVCS
jgi:hypothetical protein